MSQRLTDEMIDETIDETCRVCDQGRRPGVHNHASPTCAYHKKEKPHPAEPRCLCGGALTSIHIVYFFGAGMVAPIRVEWPPPHAYPRLLCDECGTIWTGHGAIAKVRAPRQPASALEPPSTVVEQLQSKIDRLREALLWYADIGNHGPVGGSNPVIWDDDGRRARETLAAVDKSLPVASGSYWRREYAALTRKLSATQARVTAYMELTEDVIPKIVKEKLERRAGTASIIVHIAEEVADLKRRYWESDDE